MPIDPDEPARERFPLSSEQRGPLTPADYGRMRSREHMQRAREPEDPILRLQRENAGLEGRLGDTKRELAKSEARFRLFLWLFVISVPFAFAEIVQSLGREIGRFTLYVVAGLGLMWIIGSGVVFWNRISGRAPHRE